MLRSDASHSSYCLAACLAYHPVWRVGFAVDFGLEQFRSLRGVTAPVGTKAGRPMVQRVRTLELRDLLAGLWKAKAKGAEKAAVSSGYGLPGLRSDPCGVSTRGM